MMEAILLLNQEQILVYDKVIKKIESIEGGLFFLDVQGGNGKTSILNLLLPFIQKNKGVTVALLSGRRIKHLVFKLYH